MVIAVDFDGTLDDYKVQRFILKAVREGNEIWVVTARRDNDFNRNKIKPILDKCFISEHQVIFCDEKPKIEYIKGINADLYIDNIDDELEDLKEYSNTLPLFYK